jgi:hypothetical protein
MAYNKSEWECGICKKDLKKKSVQCYLGKKYCYGECTLEAFVRDENMELYRVVEKNPYKRETMRLMIDAKYRVVDGDVDVDGEAEPFGWLKDLMGWG